VIFNTIEGFMVIFFCAEPISYLGGESNGLLDHSNELRGQLGDNGIVYVLDTGFYSFHLKKKKKK
jgi:hypothetical protein